MTSDEEGGDETKRPSNWARRISGSFARFGGTAKEHETKKEVAPVAAETPEAAAEPAAIETPAVAEPAEAAVEEAAVVPEVATGTILFETVS